jgi:hypothetical protein
LMMVVTGPERKAVRNGLLRYRQPGCRTAVLLDHPVDGHAQVTCVCFCFVRVLGIPQRS